jgi:putative PIN family toxin of toxin-antitoxin system
MSLYKAVIDTNVLYAGLYSKSGASFQVLRLIEHGWLVPQLSVTLVFEYEDVLKRNQHELQLSDSETDDVLNGLCACGEHRQIHFLWRPQLSDPKGDHVLELAVAANGVDIVTHNLKDFRHAAQFGIRAITPAQLYGELK